MVPGASSACRKRSSKGRPRLSRASENNHYRENPVRGRDRRCKLCRHKTPPWIRGPASRCTGVSRRWIYRQPTRLGATSWFLSTYPEIVEGGKLKTIIMFYLYLTSL